MTENKNPDPPPPAPLPADGAAPSPAMEGRPIGNETGSAPKAYCTTCRAWVAPINEGGQCPACGRPTIGSSLAKKRRVNKARVEQLFAEAVAEYRPTTLETRDACRFLAAIKERLEAERLGSPEHQRLMTQWADLSTLLREARGAATASSDISAASRRELAERLIEQARFLLNAEDFDAGPRGDHVDGGFVDEATRTSANDSRVSTAVDAPATATPAPQAACPYCRATPCRGPEHFAFDVLHWSDAEQIKRRDARATREMFEMLGRPLGEPHLDARVGPRVDPLAGLSPEEREREEQAREVRQRLGWE